MFNNTNLIFQSFAFIIASPTTTKKEGDSLAMIGYKQYYELTSHKKLMKYHEVQEELVLLIQQIEQHPLRFSASGFFIIDYSMLLTIAGSVMSYVIILVQFK